MARLDVLSLELVQPDNPLLGRSPDTSRRLVTLSYVGGITEGMFYRAHRAMRENIARLEKGDPLLIALTRGRLSGYWSMILGTQGVCIATPIAKLLKTLCKPSRQGCRSRRRRARMLLCDRRSSGDRTHARLFQEHSTPQ